MAADHERDPTDAPSVPPRVKRPVSTSNGLPPPHLTTLVPDPAAPTWTPDPPERKAAPAKAPEPAGASVEDIIASLFPQATVARVLPVTDRRVFRALWKAHRVRAQTDGDHTLAVSASVLLDAATRVADRALVAAAIDMDGRQHGIWLDTATGTVLALTPPDYLAGL